MADPVAAIKFEFPPTAATTTLFFRPGNAGIIITEKVLEPIQFLDESVSGTVTTKQLSANRKVVWDATFAYMPAAETLAGLTGFTGLQTFFESTVNQGASTFKITDKDSTTINCRLVPGSFRWRRGEGNIQDVYFFGSFRLIKIV